MWILGSINKLFKGLPEYDQGNKMLKSSVIINVINCEKWLKSMLILTVMSGSVSSALIGNLFYKVEFILPNGDRCALRSDLWVQILNRFRVI